MFQNYQPNIESMQQYLAQDSQRGEGPSWWSIPAGMSSVRILPPWDPTGRIALPVYMHPIEYKGEGMSFTKYNWTCVNKTFNKPCSICEGLSSLAAAGIDTDNWGPNRRQFYFNAIVMHDPTYNNNQNKGTAPGTHVLMKAPKTFYDWIISQITNPMIGDITSITNGIDVYITKEGSGLGTTYSMTLSPNGRTAVPQEYLDKITDLYNLDDIFSVGFDQKQVDELVASLKKSAGVMSNSIPNMQQQMAGYAGAPQVAPQQFTQAPVQQIPFAPLQPQANPFGSTTGNPVPQANPFGGTTDTPPWENNTVQNVPPTQPVNTSTSQENLPKCFGKYDAGNVNCVVCPVEVKCTQSSTH